MNQDFINDLAETLEVDPKTITEDYVLEGSNMWDSMSIVGTIAIIDERFGKSVSGDSLQECTTVGDIMRLVEQSA